MSKVHRNSLRKRFIAFLDDRFYCDGKDYWVSRLDDLIQEYNRLMELPEFKDDPQYKTNTVAEWYVMMQAIYNLKCSEDARGSEYIHNNVTKEVSKDGNVFLESFLDFKESFKFGWISYLVLVVLSVLLVYKCAISWITALGAHILMFVLSYAFFLYANRR